MIKSVTVKPDTTASKILFFDKIDFLQLPNPKIIPLYGANGSGKTTLLKELQFAMFAVNNEPIREDDDIGARMTKAMKKTAAGIEHDAEVEIDCDYVKTVYFKYRNGQDNFRLKEPRNYAESFDPMYLSMKYDAQSLSEGQSIVFSVEELLKGMLKSNKKHESFVDDNTHAIVLLDEIDSGLSLDNLDKMLRIIARVIKEGRNIQFIMSFNNPYVLTYFPYVVSMYDGCVHKLDTAGMLKDLKANQKMLDKARKSRGKYKIFD